MILVFQNGTVSADKILILCRIMVIFIAILLFILVYSWSKKLYGEKIGFDFPVSSLYFYSHSWLWNIGDDGCRRSFRSRSCFIWFVDFFGSAYK